MKQLLTSCGGEEFIPLFAKKELTFKEVQYMEDKDLRGVRNNSAKPFQTIFLSLLDGDYK